MTQRGGSDGVRLDRSVGDLLDGLGDGRISGPAGCSAAVTAALAASLVMRTARSAQRWPDGPGTIAQAEALQRRLLSLAQRDQDAHEQALTLLAQAAGTEQPAHVGPGQRDGELATALQRAASVPLAIAQTAADVALLAAGAAHSGPPETRADAQAAVDLARAASAAAARLVLANLTVPADHPLARQAQLAVDVADRAHRDSEGGE